MCAAFEKRTLTYKPDDDIDSIAPSDFEVENDAWDGANITTLRESLHIPHERLGF